MKIDSRQNRLKAVPYLSALPVNTGSIHQSDVKMWLRCPRYFMYRNKWGLRPKFEGGGAASLGSIFHRLMEMGEEGVPLVANEIRNKQKKMMQQIEAGEDLIGDIAKHMNSITDLYNKALAVAKIFWSKYPQQENLVTICKEVKVETPIIVNEEEIMIGGTIDRIVVDTINDNNIWIRDYKSTSRDIDTMLSGLGWGLQLRFYRLLAHAIPEVDAYIKGGAFVRGAIIDAVKMPTIKYCKKDKDFDAYVDRCKTWYEEKGIVTMSSQAVLFEEPMMPSDLEDVLCGLLPRYKDKEVNLLDYPRDITRSFCNNYDRKCPYYDMCNSNCNMWQMFIERFYDVHKEQANE